MAANVTNSSATSNSGVGVATTTLESSDTETVVKSIIADYLTMTVDLISGVYM
jgi:hypothetical protein